MDTDWSALRPDPRNARKHTSRNRQLLSASLAEVGAARSIVIDEDGTILAGNATAEAARKKGLRLQIIDTEGDTLIAVRRSGLTEMQKTRLALYDNRSAEMAEWNLDVLQALTHDDWTGILEPVDLKGLGADISIWDIPADQLPESEPEPEPEPEPERVQSVFPLAIVLSRSEHSEWQAEKAKRSCASDKDLLLALLRG